MRPNTPWNTISWLSIVLVGTLALLSGGFEIRLRETMDIDSLTEQAGAAHANSQTWPAGHAKPGQTRHLVFVPVVERPSARWHSAQLHAHAWSNHNAGTQPGSLQLHTAWAERAGLDAIWWTEHNPVFSQENDVVVDFSQATMTNTLDVEIPLPPGIPFWSRANYIALLKATTTGSGQQSVALEDGTLRMSLQNGGAPTATFAYHSLNYLGGPVQGHMLVRPLVSDPVLSFDAGLCSDSSSATFAEVRVVLSWHDLSGAQPQELIYRLVPAHQAATLLSSSTRVTVTVPLTTTQVALPLAEAAAYLPDGDDNAIQDLQIAVGAGRNATACLEIADLQLRSRRPNPSDSFGVHRQVVQRLLSRHGVMGISGWEQFSGLRHLNPYLPAGAVVGPGLHDIQAWDFAPLVHSHGGLVALAHPFGAWSGPFVPPDEQEARLQALLDILLPVNAWGIDLIEIYPLGRAQVDLVHHLRLWDLLAVNGVPMCAISASDQHGGPFRLDGPAYMVSWIEAVVPEQNALLSGLRRCRVFFGSLAQFDGILDLHLDGVPMGGIYEVKPGTGLLDIIVRPLPPAAEVRLVQAVAQPGRTITYLVDHELVDPARPVEVDTSQPGFLRVEVWGADGAPIAFSNRIYLESASSNPMVGAQEAGGQSH